MRHNERAQWEGLRSDLMNASHGPWPGGGTAFLLVCCIKVVEILFVVCNAFECAESLKNHGYLCLSPHESSVIPKTFDRCAWFSPCLGRLGA